MVLFESIAETTQGVQLSKSYQYSEDSPNRIRYLYINDFLKDNKKTFVENNYPNKIVTENDLVMANTGSPGRVFKGKQGVLSNNLFRIKIDSSILDRDYFYFILSSQIFQSSLQEQMKGGIQKHLGHKTIAKQKIPLPKLDTQKKTASILDEADKLHQLNKQLIAKYDALTQSLFLDMFGDPVTNPKGWLMKEMQFLTSKIGSGSTPRGGKESYLEEGISLIRSLNIYDNKFKYKNLAFISDVQADQLKNVIVEENDVLFNITGASICRSTIVPNKVLPARVNQHVSILRPIKDKLNSIFLNHFLISENVKHKLLGVGSGGGAVMQAITKEQLKTIEVIKPPIELQNQFAERVQIIGQQKQQAQDALQRSEDLFNSLLQKAFKGELVK